MPEPRVAIVVPWRAGDRDRELAWAWCREWWSQFGWPIYEVEHAPPVPFNRSWCINEGARRAQADGGFDVLVAIDADVFEENPAQVPAGVTHCWETGKLVVPHIVGADLNAAGTRALVGGQETTKWSRQTAGTRDPCTSRVTMIRADVFEQVGGFDQRFQGWGHEDVAFWAATVLVNGVVQLPGTCWHLWHTPSLRAARMTPQWKAGAKLADRYLNAFRNGWVAMERLLAERNEGERYESEQAPGSAETPQYGGIDVIVLTAGRQAYLEQTIASFEEHVKGPIGRKTIQDDSGDPAFGEWLHATYPKWDIITTSGRIGFTRAIINIWQYELNQNGVGAPYIFHLEEDFTFNMDIYLNEMIAVLEYDPRLAQVALLREAWAEDEKQAGGIVQQHPESYQELNANGLPYLRHRRYFTTNPCVYRRTLMERGWPNLRNSEIAFTKRMRARSMYFAYFGNGVPQVTHIGDERVGIGY